jgi:hypothetical protein
MAFAHRAPLLLRPRHGNDQPVFDRRSSAYVGFLVIYAEKVKWASK